MPQQGKHAGVPDGWEVVEDTTPAPTSARASGLPEGWEVVEDKDPKSVLGFLGNAAESGYNLAKGTVEGGLLVGKMQQAALTNPLMYVTDPTLRGMVEGVRQAGVSGIAKGAKEYFGKRYGGVQNVIDTAYEDPFGLAGDVATVASLGGGAAARAPGVIGRVGRGVAAVGGAVDPMANVGRLGGVVAPYAGKVAERVGEGLNASALGVSRALAKRNPNVNIPRAMAEEGIVMSRSGRAKLDNAIALDDAGIDRVVGGSTKTIDPNDVVQPLRELADERRGLMPGASLTDEAATVDAKVKQILEANTPAPAPAPVGPLAQRGPLAPPPIQPGRATSQAASEPGYLYHATNEEGAREIAHSGVRTFRPSHGTPDQNMWPDGGVDRRSYWTQNAGGAESFAPAEGRSALVRTKQGPAFTRESGTGDYVTRSAVGPGQLEVMDASGQWHPISSLRGEGLRVQRGGREITLRRKATIDPGELDQRLPRAGATVDGRVVRGDTPNMGSIESSFEKSTTLPGVREIPMSEFDPTYKPGSYNANENIRTAKLRAAIEASGEISPLIVAYDSHNFPHIVEGGHRFDALHAMGAKSIPARVVIDTSEVRLGPRKGGTVPPPPSAGPRGISVEQAQRTKVALNARLAKTFGAAPDTALATEMLHAERKGLMHALEGAEPEIADINKRLGRRYAVGEAMDQAAARPSSITPMDLLRGGTGSAIGGLVGGGVPGAIVGGAASMAMKSPYLKSLAARELFRASRNGARGAATFEASGPMLTRLAVLAQLAEVGKGDPNAR